MDSKEAIEQIENYVKALDMIGEPESKLYTALKQVAPLLQQGEAYRQMWEELEKEYSIPQEPEDVKYTRRSILNKIKRIANKYYWKYVKTEKKEAKNGS